METSINKRTFEGIVTSDKMSKTIVVRVDRTKMHERYGKRFAISKKYKVHDEKGEAHIGDLVRFEECSPISKDKRCKLSEILKVAPKHVALAEDAVLTEVVSSKGNAKVEKAVK